MSNCPKCGNKIPKGAQYCSICGVPIDRINTENTSKATAGPTNSSTYKFRNAFWGERFFAWLIDMLIVGVVLGIISLFSWLTGQSFFWWTNWSGWAPLLNINAGGLVYFLYWLIMDGFFGQSFGKMFVGLRVISTRGNSIGFGSAVLESLGKAFLLPLDCLLGWILYPLKRQRFFNYLSETIVVRSQ